MPILYKVPTMSVKANVSLYINKMNDTLDHNSFPVIFGTSPIYHLRPQPIWPQTAFSPAF